MNYTKGEWKAYKDPLTKNTYTIDIKHTGHEKVYQEVAIVFGVDNARLISAAPDMYEIFKNIIIQFEHGDMELDAHIEKDIRAAIAKAEGKEVKT